MLRHFVRTALLCAVLGVGLYLALSALASGLPGSHLWLTLVLAGSASAFLAWQIWSALASGHAAVAKGSEVRRSSAPRAFYGWVGFWSVCLLAMVGVLLWALARLTLLLT